MGGLKVLPKVELGGLWSICTTMAASDFANTLQMALKAPGLSHTTERHQPRLLSDDGP